MTIKKSKKTKTTKPAAAATTKHATLTLPDGTTLQLPISSGTMGPDVIHIAGLKSVDLFTYDPGFIATASCASRITYIDGDRGELLYRGYPIELLANKRDFMQVCYLLYHGQLPTPKQDRAFRTLITRHTMVTVNVERFIRGFRNDAHPMSMLIAVVGAAASFYHGRSNVKNADDRFMTAVRLVAKLPTFAAMAYKYSIGQRMMYPQNHLGFVENFLHMMFATPCEPYKVDKVLVSALDKIFTLHADHEQNASTSTVRLVGSSNAEPFACISAGIASLWGPAHGGANQAVLEMLEAIGEVENIPAYIADIKSGASGKRLMGFGHRVYKNYDPRAKIMRDTCYAVLKHLKLKDDRIFKIALELEKITLSDDYFISRKLYPNVDFYSGIVLRAIGIPTTMFTAIFAIARTIGWISHWNEMHEDPEFRIGRPRQLFLGAKRRKLTK